MFLHSKKSLFHTKDPSYEANFAVRSSAGEQSQEYPHFAENAIKLFSSRLDIHLLCNSDIF